MAALLQVMIGLVFVYLVMSILCSGVNEFIAQKVGRRGEFLKLGLHNILTDRWIYLRVINHPIVATMYREQVGRKLRHPSYIPSKSFALALLEVIKRKAGQLQNPVEAGPDGRWSVADLKKAAAACEDYGYSVGGALVPLLDGANGNYERAVANIQEWFDSSMDRVAGWYKRRTQVVLCMIAICSTVLLNVDTIQIARAISSSATLRQQLESVAVQVVEENRDDSSRMQSEQLPSLVGRMQALEAEGLPIGFSCLSIPSPNDGDRSSGQGLSSMLNRCVDNTLGQLNSGSWLLKVLGWGLTILAITLGAQFWFDLLQKLIDLRSTGRKPGSTTATATSSPGE